MARFLSAEWFVALGNEVLPGPAYGPSPGAGQAPEGQPGVGVPADAPAGAVNVEIVVTGAPEGELRYQVVVEGSSVGARWRQEQFLVPDVRFSCDYPTISAIGQGRLDAVQALAQGLARVA